MKNSIIKFFLIIVIVVLLGVLIQKIQVVDTATIDLDYWTNEEMAIQYLYYIK